MDFFWKGINLKDFNVLIVIKFGYLLKNEGIKEVRENLNFYLSNFLKVI